MHAAKLWLTKAINGGADSDTIYELKNSENLILAYVYTTGGVQMISVKSVCQQCLCTKTGVWLVS